jgi:hypothetical protein
MKSKEKGSEEKEQTLSQVSYEYYLQGLKLKLW